MKNSRYDAPLARPLALFLLIALVAPAIGNAQQLLPGGASDLSPDTLTAAPRLKGVEVPREAVSLSWPLAEGTALEQSAPFVSRSREYFVDATAAELVRGVPVFTTAPGALVRVHPAGRTGIDEELAILPEALELIDARGTSWIDGGGMDLMVGPDQLKAAGAPFAESTSAFRIREDLGAGAFTLRAAGLATGSDRYAVHVFDRGSPVSLSLTTGASDYLHGQTLTVEARLADGSHDLPVRRIDGFVTSPGGRAWPLTFRAAGSSNRYRASLTLDAREVPAPGLWQVHVSADGHTGGQAVLRAGRTAFACAVASARFTGAVEVGADGLGFRLGVDAASAGRYEARGVLYATAKGGTLRPTAVAHAAAWLEAGSGSLELAFDPQLLAGGELSAPFELRDLRLVDQVSMGLLHRQERALTVGR